MQICPSGPFYDPLPMDIHPLPFLRQLSLISIHCAAGTGAGSIFSPDHPVPQQVKGIWIYRECG